MPALTLVEAAKHHSGDVFRQGVIETIGTQGQSILSYIPFMNINGGAYSYAREAALPSVGFRGINEEYDTSIGVINPQVEALTVFGGSIDVDKALIKMHGEDQRDIQEEMQLKAMVLSWNRTFIKGDSSTNPREFDGLQRRLVVGGDQVIENSTASGGGALSLDKLDELIDAVEMPTHLIMNRVMRRRLSRAVKDTDVAGNLNWGKDDAGRRIMFYNDLPIIDLDKDDRNELILPFTEAPLNGAANCTSIYCVSLGDGKLVGLQNSDVEAEDLGLLDNGTIYRTTVEHLQSIALLTDKAAARLRGITDAAVVA